MKIKIVNTTGIRNFLEIGYHLGVISYYYSSKTFNIKKKEWENKATISLQKIKKILTDKINTEVLTIENVLSNLALFYDTDDEKTLLMCIGLLRHEIDLFFSTYEEKDEQYSTLFNQLKNALPQRFSKCNLSIISDVEEFYTIMMKKFNARNDFFRCIEQACLKSQLEEVTDLSSLGDDIF